MIRHILEVTYTWPAETFIVRHVDALSEYTDLNISIAAKSPSVSKSASIQPIIESNNQIHYLPNFDHLSFLKKVKLALQSGLFSVDNGEWRIRDKAILRTLSSLDADLIHFHFGGLAVMLASYADALSIPYTISLRGSDIQVNVFESDEYRQNLCKVLRNAVGIHTVCDSFANLIKARCNLVHETTTIRTCLPDTSTPENNIDVSQEDSKYRLITVGRLHWRKGLSDLIHAMRFLGNVSLDIVGDGEEKEHLQFLIHEYGLVDRVHIHGSLPYSQFKPLLEGASAYVQASVAEGFSNALAEAMMLGKPVFATPVGGTQELIEDGKNGILLPTGDSKSIADKLTLVHDVELMKKIGRSARITALHEFDMQHHAMQFSNFFKQALTNAKSTL